MDLDSSTTVGWTSADNRVQTELEKRLGKTNEKELRSEEQALLKEARAKSPKDAKTRRKLEDLIRSEVQKRIRAAQPPIKGQPSPSRPRSRWPL